MSGRGNRRRPAEGAKQAQIAAVREERRIAGQLDQEPEMRRLTSLLHDMEALPGGPDWAELWDVDDVELAAYLSSGRRIV